MFKKILIISIGVTLFIATAYLILPKPLYSPATWSIPADGGLRKFQFSKYLLPEPYKMIGYADSLEDRKVFILFQNQKSGQYYGTFILRELPKVNFDKVTFENKKIKRTIARYYMMDVTTDPNFKLLYLVPLLINEDLKAEFPHAAVRDINVLSKERFETEKTDVLLVEGKFRELGFYRVGDSPFVKYPVPVFSFKYPMKGALALINNKANGETIFAFGCTESFKDFDKDEFKTIVQSITFDKEPRTIKDLFGIDQPEKTRIR